MIRSLTIIWFLALLIFQSSAQAITGGASEMYETIAQFQEDVESLSRKYTLTHTPEYYDRFNMLYTAWQKELAALSVKQLSKEGQADLVMLRNHIAREAYFLKLDQEKYLKISHTMNFAEPLYAFIRARRYGEIPAYQSLAKTMQDICKELPEQQKQLKTQPFESWLIADKSRAAVQSLRDNLKEAYGFYYGYDPQFTWWMEKPYAQLDEALKNYGAFLATNYANTSVKDDGSGIIGKPIGKQAIMKSLEFSYIPYTPEELIEAAEKQFKYCEAEMLRASAELGFDKDWKKALEHVKNTYVPPGEQPKIIDSLAWEAIKFIEDRDLITVPALAKETWRMIMMTPDRQRVNPFFTGGEEISISYPTHTMEHDEKMMSMRGNNPNFSTATVHHELIPGHHMQQFMNSRYKPYRWVFSTPFWTEGWALYWEINLWNKGFPDTPEEKIGMLFWRMHRCARIIFSLSYHLEKMTPQQCIDLLVNRVGHEYANAEAEVRRSFVGGYDPLYQIAYMIGGLQFFALQKELVKAGWTEKQYHDAVMKEGNIPIEILRILLKGGEFDDNFKSKWRFSMDFQ